MTVPTIGATSVVSGDLMPGPNDAPITIENMIERGKVLTLEDARRVLSTTEPLAHLDFETGDQVSFRVEDGWNNDVKLMHGTDPVEVYVNITSGQNDGREYRLTLDALHQATTACGLGKGYIDRAPAFLTEQALEYWFRTGLDRDFRLHVIGEDQLGMAMTRDTVEPFSNLALLDAMLERIEAAHPGARVYVDRNKMSHSLRLTHLQLILPDLARTMTDTGEVMDQWWGGVQLTNSMTAEAKTAATGFLFRQRCTNGMIDVAPADSEWNRRQNGQDEGNVLAWARQTIDEILGHLDHSFDKIQETVSQPVDDLETLVEDMFTQYRVPVPAQRRITDLLAAGDDISMYWLTQAVTQAANGDVPTSQQQLLMAAGGDIAHHAARCDSCHRMLPEGAELDHQH